MISSLKSIRVLMIGPGEGVTGGISTLVASFLPALEKQVSLCYLPSVSQRPLKDSGKLSFRNLVIAFSQYARFIGSLARFRPDMIHLHTSQGLAWLKDTFYVVLGKALRKRIILHMHGGNFDAIYHENPRIIRAYTRWVLGMADAVIAVSAEWKTRFENILPSVKVFPLKNCIDVQVFRPNNCPNSSRTVNILFIGRIGPLKGAFDLIEAIHSIHQAPEAVHVWLVGPEERDGDFRSALQLIKEYRLNDTCELLGSISRSEVLNLFRRASIFVLPSYYEGLPMVILEALAAGLPVIATPVGGIPEVVHDGCNGFLIPPGDISASINSLDCLVSDAELRRQMGRRSREIAECELDVTPYVDRITELYRSLSGIEK